MPLDPNWIERLSPDEAQAALDSLDAHKGPYSVREATELLRMQKKPRSKDGKPQRKAIAEYYLDTQ